MIFGFEPQQLAIMALAFIACGGLILVVVFPMLNKGDADPRVKAVGGKRGPLEDARQSAIGRLMGSKKENRRKQIQDSIKQIEENERQRRKRITLRTLIVQAGLQISPRQFWLASASLGLAAVVVCLVLRAPWYVALLSSVVGVLGVPRWVLAILRKRRRNAFVKQFADAIDVMVRGLRAGLPMADALKVIAEEVDPPVGPEFRDVIEGLRLGVTVEQGFERMYERVPAPEVNFLGIAFSIQTKTGGNMSEALGNLSRVLRERAKMKGKVAAVSQEAKSSAGIIGALPFAIIGLLMLVNPDYLRPLFESETGKMMLVASGCWMMIGVLVMRKMIQFDI